MTHGWLLEIAPFSPPEDQNKNKVGSCDSRKLCSIQRISDHKATNHRINMGVWGVTKEQALGSCFY